MNELFSGDSEVEHNEKYNNQTYNLFGVFSQSNLSLSSTKEDNQSFFLFPLPFGRVLYNSLILQREKIRL